MAAEWDEQQAYEELLYWDGLIQQGHRLLPEDFDRYEELRYWYDCLCYKEELRQYHEYISAVKELEDKRQLEVIFFHLLYNTRFVICCAKGIFYLPKSETVLS
ncbi:hypothetical protein XENOCAPTIV_027218 [Xenoophorus captivus]|uniref:Uncharacterized protein n=1 Tax=Xenoophorus captivus TaxID=1517983 RepID=A0ABV0RNI4_9TELE